MSVDARCERLHEKEVLPTSAVALFALLLSACAAGMRFGDLAIIEFNESV